MRLKLICDYYSPSGYPNPFWVKYGIRHEQSQTKNFTSYKEAYSWIISQPMTIWMDYVIWELDFGWKPEVLKHWQVVEDFDGFAAELAMEESK